MSNLVIYNKIFGSDIFNRKNAPSLNKNTSRGRNLDNTNNNDVFNTTNTFDNSFKPTRHSMVCVSDIFNINSKPDKPRRIRNHSQSDIFFIEGKKQPSYDIYYPRVQYESKFKPEDNIKLNDSYKMKMKDMYGIDPNKSDKSITSSKGYCEYMDYKYYNTENNNKQEIKGYDERTKAKEFNLKKVNLMELNRNKNPNANPREQYMSDHLSNVFHDKEIEKKNKVIKPSNVQKEPKNTYHLTQPKHIPHKNKWISKLKWNNPQNELIFKQTCHTDRQPSAHERKLNELASDAIKEHISPDPSSYQKPKAKVLNMNNDYVKPKIPGLLHSAKKAKLTQNASNFNNDHFYEDNYKCKLINDSDIKEHMFSITNADNLDKKDLMKVFNSNGVHIYNIQEFKDNIFNDNGNRNRSYLFMVRDNNTGGKGKNFENASKQIKEKFKDVEIVKKDKIVVNKKKHTDISNTKKDTYKVNESSKENKAATYRRNNDIDRSFSNQYRNINYSYKSFGSKSRKK